MPKSTYARDGDPFAGLRLCFFDAFVSCDSGADDWRCIHRSKAVRYMCDIIWICQKVLGESSILGIAAKLCFSADCLPGLQAKLAMTARGVKPGHADAIALLDNRHA